MKKLNLFFYFLVGLVVPHTDNGQNVFTKMGYAQQRCCNKGCIAQLRPGNGELVAKVIKKSDVESIYFSADSYELHEIAANQISEFAGKTDGDVSIIGYTDGCGTASYNRGLSSNRAKEVSTEYRKHKPNTKIGSYAAGEISNDHDPISRRVDITLTRNVNLYAPPPKIVADVYLIDGSQSMEGAKWKKYKRSIEYHRPDHARVYISTTRCIANGTPMGSISPSGKTEIWFSYWTVMDTMSRGQTLAIISDFQSYVGLTAGEHRMLTHKAETKGIKVISVKL